MRSAGCGWNAGVLLDSIGACRDIVVRFVLDKNPVKWGKTFWGVLVRGGDDLLSALTEEGITHFIVGVGATTDNAARRRLFDFAVSHRLQPLSVIHASAICSKRASLSDGVQILAGAVVVKDVSGGVTVVGVPARPLDAGH